jgi:hypothetical protein
LLPCLTDPPQGGSLIAAEAVTPGCPPDGRFVSHGDPGVTAADERVEDPSFPGQRLAGGVARGAVAFMAGEPVLPTQTERDLGGQGGGQRLGDAQ